MSNVTIQKRGNFYQYKFEIAKVDGKRKFLSKSVFKTKSEEEKEGVIAYNDYLNTGNSFSSSDMSYSDFLDYWLENYCFINLKYHAIVGRILNDNKVEVRLGIDKKYDYRRTN